MSQPLTVLPDTYEDLNFNADDARLLFEQLDHIHLVAIHPDPPQSNKPFGQYFGVKVDQALEWARKANGNGYNVYWTLNYVGPGVRTKPDKDQIQAARGAHCDKDPPKDGSPWDKGAVIAALTDHAVPPSLIIDSGNGVQPVWLFGSPEKDKASVETVNRGLEAVFGGDHCHNIDRLLRIPGSVNYPNKAKRDRGCVPCMASWVQQDTGQRYELHELAAAFPFAAEPTKPRGNDKPVNLPSDIPLITPDDLEFGPLSPIRSAIEHPPGRDRSGDGLAVAGLMARAGYADEQIAGILLNPANAVSAHYLDQRDPRRAALRSIEYVRNDTPPSNDTTDQAEPVDLWARYSEPPLPMGLLPDVIERFAVRQGAIMGADPAGLAMAALTVCAAALPDSIFVQVKRNDPSWRENARIWAGLVGLPSRKKTPVMRVAIAPLRTIDDTLMRKYMAQVAEYEALPVAERKAAERPKQTRAIIADATIEAAQEVLRDSPAGVLSEQDELSGWFGAMDKYSPGKGAQADRAFWLKSYNGGSYNLNRISRGVVHIPNLSICLLGGIQPEPLRKLADETVDDGLIQRLIPVILRPAAVGMDAPADRVVAEYGDLVARLHAMRPPSHGGAISLADYTNPQPVHLSSEARDIREKLEREHLQLVEALETVNPKLASHFGKYDGLFARLVLLWHCIEHSDATSLPVEISGDTALRVEKFMAEFIRPSAIAFYAGLLGMSAGHEDVMALAALIVARGLEEVTARDVQRAGQLLRHYTADACRLLFEKLEAFGWLFRCEPGAKSNKPRWIVNPRVHALFADRGKEEAERRQSAKEALANALRS